MPSKLANSRFNPAPGVADFWSEFRKPNPYRIPILLASMMPFGVIMWWLTGETLYKDPERPTITYITTFDPTRTDAEIVASNIANQEVKELREARQQALAERKRDLYKALGAAAGMDVEEIDRRAREERAAEEAAREAELEQAFGSVDENANSQGLSSQEAVGEPSEAQPETQSSVP